jgi:hypothetical protein
MRIALKIALVFIVTFSLYYILSLFVEHRGDINSLGGWYYGILSLLSLFNSLFVFILLKFKIWQKILNPNWKIIVLIIWLYLCGNIIDKVIYLIPKKTTGDSFFYDVPATLLYPYLITIFFTWLLPLVFHKKNK